MESQVIVDFLANFALSNEEVMNEPETSSAWKLFVDG